MKKHIEVELVGNATNAAVVKLPGRRFPGIIIQGDSLANLNAMVETLLRALSDGRLDEAGEEGAELQAILRGYKAAYEAAMTTHGLELPYVTKG